MRKQAGISGGTILTWQVHDNALVARPRKDSAATMKRHIRNRAGSWRGKISGVELLKRTGP